MQLYRLITDSVTEAGHPPSSIIHKEGFPVHLNRHMHELKPHGYYMRSNVLYVRLCRRRRLLLSRKWLLGLTQVAVVASELLFLAISHQPHPFLATLITSMSDLGRTFAYMATNTGSVPLSVLPSITNRIFKSTIPHTRSTLFCFPYCCKSRCLLRKKRSLLAWLNVCQHSTSPSRVNC